jgi:glycosyltransferase involved in cell wall biosynthesis
MNTLFISYDGLTDPLGQSQILPYMIGLSKKGHSISILSCEKSQKFIERKQEIQNICNTYNIQWFPIKYRNKIPVLSTVYNVFELIINTSKIIKLNKIQLLHCRSYISALVGLRFKRKNKTKFLFDMRGFWADERIDGNIWNIEKPLYKKIYTFFKKKELEYFNEADACVSLTYAGKNEILSWYKDKNKKPNIHVIPCCADLNHFNKNNVNKTRALELQQQYNIPANTFVLCYLGAVGTWYMTHEMLEFYKVLKTRYTSSIFLFCTAEEPQIVIEACKKNNVDVSDIRIEKVARTDVPAVLSFCNLSVFFIKQSYSKLASSPTKLGELLSMGVPVIC